MEIIDKGTKLLMEVVGQNNKPIDTYSISQDGELVFKLQVSGEIQAFETVEIGLYTLENVPLCAFGPFVIKRISLSRFLLTMHLIAIGVYHPKKESTFAHVSYWTEDNTSHGVALDFKETQKFWKEYLPDKKSIELKLMLSGYKPNSKKTFIRDVTILKLIP